MEDLSPLAGGKDQQPPSLQLEYRQGAAEARLAAARVGSVHYCRSTFYRHSRRHTERGRHNGNYVHIRISPMTIAMTKRRRLAEKSRLRVPVWRIRSGSTGEAIEGSQLPVCC